MDYLQSQQLQKKLRSHISPANGRDQLLDRKLHFHTAALDGLASADKESHSTGVGSKTKACLKFFSTSGCPYGEDCHFAHYVPGGLASVAFIQPASHVVRTGSVKSPLPSYQGAALDGQKPCKRVNIGTAHQEKEIRKFNSSFQVLERALEGFSQGPSTEGYKMRLCKNLQSSEGCRFGEKCYFAHGEEEVRRANGSTAGGIREPAVGAAASFGSVSTAKISIDASLAGLIIGKAGTNAKAICRATGAKLFVKDHESDLNLRNIEMEGSFDQIQCASTMVRELLVQMDITTTKPGGIGTPNFKTKLCENFVKGSCTYGDRCHFAHGSDELRVTVSQ